MAEETGGGGYTDDSAPPIGNEGPPPPQIDDSGDTENMQQAAGDSNDTPPIGNEGEPDHGGSSDTPTPDYSASTTPDTSTNDTPPIGNSGAPSMAVAQEDTGEPTTWTPEESNAYSSGKIADQTANDFVSNYNPQGFQNEGGSLNGEYQDLQQRWNDYQTAVASGDRDPDPQFEASIQGEAQDLQTRYQDYQTRSNQRFDENGNPTGQYAADIANVNSRNADAATAGNAYQEQNKAALDRFNDYTAIGLAGDGQQSATQPNDGQIAGVAGAALLPGAINDPAAQALASGNDSFTTPSGQAVVRLDDGSGYSQWTISGANDPNNVLFNDNGNWRAVSRTDAQALLSQGATPAQFASVANATSIAGQAMQSTGTTPESPGFGSRLAQAGGMILGEGLGPVAGYGIGTAVLGGQQTAQGFQSGNNDQIKSGLITTGIGLGTAAMGAYGGLLSDSALGVAARSGFGPLTDTLPVSSVVKFNTAQFIGNAVLNGLPNWSVPGTNIHIPDVLQHSLPAILDNPGGVVQAVGHAYAAAFDPNPANKLTEVQTLAQDIQNAYTQNPTDYWRQQGLSEAGIGSLYVGALGLGYNGGGNHILGTPFTIDPHNTLAKYEQTFSSGIQAGKPPEQAATDAVNAIHSTVGSILWSVTPWNPAYGWLRLPAAEAAVSGLFERPMQGINNLRSASEAAPQLTSGLVDQASKLAQNNFNRPWSLANTSGAEVVTQIMGDRLTFGAAGSGQEYARDLLSLSTAIEQDMAQATGNPFARSGIFISDTTKQMAQQFANKWQTATSDGALSLAGVLHDGIARTLPDQVVGLGPQAESAAIQKAIENRQATLAGLTTDSPTVREVAGRLTTSAARLGEGSLIDEAVKLELTADIRKYFYEMAGARLPQDATVARTIVNTGMTALSNAMRAAFLVSGAPAIAVQKILDEMVRAATQGVYGFFGGRPADYVLGRGLARAATDYSFSGKPGGTLAGQFGDWLGSKSAVERYAQNNVSIPSSLYRDAKDNGIWQGIRGVSPYGQQLSTGQRVAALNPLGAANRAVDKFLNVMIQSPTQHIVWNAANKALIEQVGGMRNMTEEVINRIASTPGVTSADATRYAADLRAARSPAEWQSVYQDYADRYRPTTTPSNVATTDYRGPVGPPPGNYATSPLGMQQPLDLPQSRLISPQDVPTIHAQPRPSMETGTIGNPGAPTNGNGHVNPGSPTNGNGAFDIGQARQWQQWETIYNKAEKAGDQATMNAARSHLDRFEQSGGHPLPPETENVLQAAKEIQDANGGTFSFKDVGGVNAHPSLQTRDYNLFNQRELAKGQLSNLGLIERVGQGEYRLTDKGLQAIGEQAPTQAFQDTTNLTDWVNNRTQFHGTGTANLNPRNLTADLTNPESLYGPGVYLTDSPRIAQDYANAPRNKYSLPAVGTRPEVIRQSSVYSGKPNLENVLDLDHPATPEIKQLFLDETPHLGAPDGPKQQLIDFLNKNPDATTGQLYDQLRDIQHEWAWGGGEFDYGESFQAINQRLSEEMGYDALTHTGGVKLGGKEQHNVTILLDPQGRYATAPTQSMRDFSTPSQWRTTPLPQQLPLDGGYGKFVGDINPDVKFQSPIGVAGTPPVSPPSAEGVARYNANLASLGQTADAYSAAQRAIPNRADQLASRIIGNPMDQTNAGAALRNGLQVNGYTIFPAVLPFANFHIHTTQFWLRYFAANPVMPVMIANALQQAGIDDYGNINGISGATRMSTAAHLVDFGMQATKYFTDLRNNPNGNSILQQAGKNLAYNTIGNNAFIGTFPEETGLLSGLTQSSTNPLLNNKGKTDSRDVLRERGAENWLEGGMNLAGVPRDVSHVVGGAGNIASNIGMNAGVGLVNKLGGNANIKAYNPEADLPYLATNFQQIHTDWPRQRVDDAIKNPQSADGKTFYDWYHDVKDKQAVGGISPIRGQIPEASAGYFSGIHAQDQAAFANMQAAWDQFQKTGLVADRYAYFDAEKQWSAIHKEDKAAPNRPFYQDSLAGGTDDFPGFAISPAGFDGGINRYRAGTGGVDEQRQDTSRYNTARAQLTNENFTLSDYGRDYLKGIGAPDTQVNGNPSEHLTTTANQRLNAQEVNSDIRTGRYLSAPDRSLLQDYTNARTAYEGAPVTPGSDLKVQDLLSQPGNYYDTIRKAEDALKTGNKEQAQAYFDIANKLEHQSPAVTDYFAATAAAGQRDQYKRLELRKDDALMNPDTQDALAPLNQPARAFVNAKTGERVYPSATNVPTARDQSGTGVKSDRLYFDQWTQDQRNAYDAFNDLRNSADYKSHNTLESQLAGLTKGTAAYRDFFQKNGSELTRLSNIVNGAEQSIQDRYGVNPKDLANSRAGVLGENQPYATTAIGKTNATFTEYPTRTGGSGSGTSRPATSRSAGTSRTTTRSSSTSSSNTFAAKQQAGNDFYTAYRDLTPVDKRLARTDSAVAAVLTGDTKTLTARDYQVALDHLNQRNGKTATTATTATNGVEFTRPTGTFTSSGMGLTPDQLRRGVDSVINGQEKIIPGFVQRAASSQNAQGSPSAPSGASYGSNRTNTTSNTRSLPLAASTRTYTPYTPSRKKK